MGNLKEMLLKEQKRLEHIIEIAVDKLKDVPPGRLRLSSSNNKTQFYHCLSEDKKNGEYISKTNVQLIRQLAQKSYDEKVLKLAEKRLSQIKRITKDYDDEEIEKVFLREHSERRKLIQPIELIWEQQLKAWLEKDYKRKKFQEGTPVILTEQGERVRSKSEKILADYFYRNGIPYKYECPLYLNGLGIIHPDFTFLSSKTKKEIYWEHNGRMDDPLYAQNAVKRIHAYEENRIYPGEQLILTFETERIILDMRLIEQLVHKYLK